MFQRLSRSWSLVKASASVLAQDKELLVFPFFSSLALLVVMAGFALPIFGLQGFDQLASGPDGDPPPLAYAVAFLFYFCQYLVIFFFNTALVGAAMIRLAGGDPTVADGLRIATSRLAVIVGYAFIAATVGMILRVIQERVGFVGKIVVGLLGAGWNLATFLVVPVLATGTMGPIEAIKESAGLLRQTWGENVIGQVGMGFAFGLIFLGVIGASAVVVIMAIASGSVAAIVVAALIAGLAIAITGLVQSALMGIYAAALYRYATEGEGTKGFDTGALKLAFAPK
jgi:hypothetical protein